jgi:hypothetical protein
MSDTDDPETLPRAEIAGRLREGLTKISAILDAVIRETGGAANSPVQRTARGLLDRVACWLLTLHRLDNTTHYQASMAGLRGLLELTVDLAFLFKDPSLNDQLEAWELSAKIRHARNFSSYGKGSPVALSAAAAFINAREPQVAALRQKYWNCKTHPPRWTGRDLRSDVRLAQQVCPGLELERIFEETYSYTCWQVHGSALVGSRDAGGEDVLAAIIVGLIASGWLALGSAELAMRVLDRWSTTDQKRLKAAEDAWVLRYGGFDVVDRFTALPTAAG